MERVREAVDLARRAAAAPAAERGAAAAQKRRRRSSLSQPQQSADVQEAEDVAAISARLKLARLLPDTPADQLLASLEASSRSSAGELRVREAI